MRTITKCLIFASIVKLHIVISSGTTDTVKNVNLSDFCPYTDFCTQTANLNSSGLAEQPCCASCMCSASCLLYGNCCPDVQHKAHYNDTLPVCYFPVFNADEETLYHHDRNFVTGINSYNAFIACPISYPDDNVKSKCERVPKELTDLALVSDEKGYVYKNKHCALCHGNTQYIEWNLKIKCPTTEHESMIQMSRSLDQFEPCMVWSIPPKPSIGEKSLCYKAIDACNITGEMVTYNTALDESCNAYTLYYFDTRGKITQLFKNVHCFLCNVKAVEPQTICPLGMLNVRDSFIVDFSGVLNTGSLDIMSNPVKPTCRKRCLQRQIYDPFFDKCRRLTCPVGYRASHGECLSEYENTFGFSMSMLVDLKPVLNDPNIRVRDLFFDYPDNYYDLIKLADAVINTTDQFKNNCGLCDSVIAETGIDGNSYLEALVTFHTNLKCDINTLFKSAYVYAQNKENFISVNINSKKLVYKAAVNVDMPARYINHLSQSNKVRDVTKLCGLPVHFEGEIVCPKITLNETEYSILLAQTAFQGALKRKLRQEKAVKGEVSGENGRAENVTIDVSGENGRAENVTIDVSGENGRDEDATISRKGEISFDYDVCLEDYIEAVNKCNCIHNAFFKHGIIALLCYLAFY